MKLNEELSSFPVDYNEELDELIIHSDITESQLNDLIKILVSSKNQSNINVKELSIELKKVYFISMLNSEFINKSFLTSLLMFIKSVCNMSDDLFKSNYIVKDVTEFIDFKLSVMSELNALKSKLTLITLGILKSISRVEYNSIDNMMELSDFYNNIISNLTLPDLSYIIATDNNQISLNSVPYVVGHSNLLCELFIGYINSASLFSKLMEVKNGSR